MNNVFSSESVSVGHPDKLCDTISDSVLDACLEVDPAARVAVETLVKGSDTGSAIVLAGEVTLAEGCDVDFERVAREAAIEIGYDDHSVGLDARKDGGCDFSCLIGLQSPDIARGVDLGTGIDLNQGAGDQGIMFGFATNESEDIQTLEGVLMPVPIVLAHRLTDAITQAGRSGSIPWIRPDAKSQVSIRYENGKPSEITSLVVAVQHDDLATDMFSGSESDEHRFIESEIVEKIVHVVVPRRLITENTKVVINGTGRFILGGPYADAGLTGRKIIVDTYGGMGRHGGGAFSGKDPSKVDRSAAYAARWAAKHVVASGLSDVCEIQLAYAIGVAEPMGIRVDTQGTAKGRLSDFEISKIVEELFDFRPSSIIERLGLRRPIYKKTASGGHFGRDPEDDGGFSWELLDEEIIKKIRS